MVCKKCPHHVRHGLVDPKTKQIEFADRCALKMKEAQPCIHIPFKKFFDYQSCEVYQSTFKGFVDRNTVAPTKDFDFNDVSIGSIAEMELL